MGVKGGHQLSAKSSLIDHLFRRLSIVAAWGTVVLCLVWAAVEWGEFVLRSDALRDAQEQANRVYLKRVVDDVLEVIASERQRTSERVEKSLRGHIDEAEAIIGNLMRTQGKGRSRAEMESLIRETLRPIRFNSGRGYLFAFDLNGRQQLSPLHPEVEGANMLDVESTKGELVIRDILHLISHLGDAFYSYHWPRPGKADGDYSKVAYVRLIPALGWVIGTGEYVEDMEADIKADLLERIGKMRFGEDGDGYVFVSKWDGEALVGALKGRNPLAELDSPLRAGTLKLIAAAQAGAGYVTYPMLDRGGRMVDKTSYAAGISDWQWFVGAGLNHDRAEAEIMNRRTQLLRGLGLKLGAALVAALVVSVVALSIMRATSTRAAADAFLLEQCMENAANAPGPMDSAVFRFSEHQGFALAANALIARRQDVEAQLLERSAQLEQTNADLERFAYVAAHDLQEPLRTIGLFLQLLKRRTEGLLDDEARECVDFALSGAERMRNNIQGLLAYSRTGVPVDEFSQTDLNQIVAQVLGDLSGAMAATGAEIDAEPLPSLRVQAGQIAALLLNLLSNAIRYRHPDRMPRITLRAHQGADGDWEFQVADNGIGIPAQYRAAIFEPFRRFHPPQADGGSGIGLALCRRVVENHGGRIWVDSSDQGSVFHFSIKSGGSAGDAGAAPSA